jgi:hypothetical protein
MNNPSNAGSTHVDDSPQAASLAVAAGDGETTNNGSTSPINADRVQLVHCSDMNESQLVAYIALLSV